MSGSLPRPRSRDHRTRLAAIALGITAAAGACSSGEAAQSVDDSGEPLRITVTAPDQAADEGVDDVVDVESSSPLDASTPTDVDPDFADAPALLASRSMRGALWPTSPIRGSQPEVGPTLPAAHLPSPASVGRVQESFDDTNAVSPDGRYVAVVTPADALNDNGFDVYELASGEVVDSFDYSTEDESEGPSQIAWSPDATAFSFRDGTTLFLHRVGGATAHASAPYYSAAQVFAGGPEFTTLLTCQSSSANRLTVGTEAGSGSSDAAVSCDGVAQGVDPSGIAIAVYADGSTAKVMSATGDATEIYDSGETSSYSSVPLAGCGSIVVVQDRGRNDDGAYFYHVGAGTIVNAASWDGGACPVPDAGGARAAYQSENGTVEVVDFETGAVAEVARTGVPLAFGAGGEKLLVEANGTFIVNADGSGGAEASFQSATDNYGPHFCPAGVTGRGLLLTANGVSVVDIDEDDAEATGVDELGSGCALTPDSQWLASGSLLVDLRTTDWLVLDAVDQETGDWLDEGYGSGLAQFSWAGSTLWFSSRSVT